MFDTGRGLHEPPRTKEDKWVPMALSELNCALHHAMAVYGDLGEKTRECGHHLQLLEHTVMTFLCQICIFTGLYDIVYIPV